MKTLATLCGATVIQLSMAACNQAPPRAADTHDADVKAISDTEVRPRQGLGGAGSRPGDGLLR